MKYYFHIAILSGWFLAGCEQQTPEPVPESQASAEKIELQTASGAKPKFAEIGVAEILIPGDAAPPTGWPVALLLHGNGKSREDMRDFAPLLVQLGFASIAVSAPVPVEEKSIYTWPPAAGIKLVQRYIHAAIAPFSDSPDLNFGQTYLIGSREGAWISILLQGVYQNYYSGVIGLALRPPTDNLPNVPAPKGRPLALLSASDDNKAVFAARHFEHLWQQGQVAVNNVVIPADRNIRKQWLLETVELSGWMIKNATLKTGTLMEELPEYPE